MELQQLTSTLLDSVGFNAEESLLFVRFKGKDDIYSFANIPPEMYEEMVTSESVGKFFSQNIKPFKERFPYANLGSRVEVVADIERGWVPRSDTTDFTANGTPVPATTAPAEIELASDPEALKAQAAELSERTKAIAIVSPEAYSLAATTLLAIARMRISLETTFRPEIDRTHKLHAAACAVLNHYDRPLASDAQRLKDGMRDFKKREDAERMKAEQAEREGLQAEAEEEAKKRSVDLQISDAIAAEQRGEPEIAKMILEAPPLPMAPVYAAPVSYASTVPKEAGISHVEDWDFEIVHRKLIPEKYKIIDEKTIRNEAKRLKSRAEIPGVRFFDRGGMRVSTKAGKRGDQKRPSSSSMTASRRSPSTESYWRVRATGC